MSSMISSIDVYIDPHDVITSVMTLAAEPPGGHLDVADVIAVSDVIAVGMPGGGDVNVSGAVGTMINVLTVNGSEANRWVDLWCYF